MVADNDAGGSTTYAATGAKYGFNLIWFLLILIPVAYDVPSAYRWRVPRHWAKSLACLPLHSCKTPARSVLPTVDFLGVVETWVRL
jgi:hypothetical protein